ncbi:BolA-like protein [Chloropicon roscoffensis]|uniref:BolA-like protein n=1 Tax=Chloropicon roscoffensis TaxID=1461544 RepID=A0AAX4P563_9CHLO|mmetsp:Transcript_8870/g.26817  ORF Transcript_8870/g.26817 Transcript_8870/m.26817 type:complete len:108 (-) Transcript_8870:1301-1624(-)
MLARSLLAVRNAVETRANGGYRMVVTVAQVEEKLREALQAKELEVFDTSGGCGASFEVGLVVSEQFAGKRALQRHRLVNGALKEELEEIHALSIKKTYTPEEFEAKK